MTTPERKREEEGYIPPGHPNTMAALERWQALPPEQRAARRDEGLALRDAYMNGFGTPPPEDVAFSRPNGSQWAVEQPVGAKPASMADLRRAEDAPPVEAPSALVRDWGDARTSGATMATGRELDDAGMLGNGRRVIRMPEMDVSPQPRPPRVIALPEMDVSPRDTAMRMDELAVTPESKRVIRLPEMDVSPKDRTLRMEELAVSPAENRVIRLPEMDVSPQPREPRVIRLPEMRIPMGDEPAQDWQDAGGARPPPTAARVSSSPRPAAPRRPIVDVSQVGKANAGHLFERLAETGKAPMQPGAPGSSINPEVLAYVQKSGAPADSIQAAQDAERDRRMALAIGRAGAMANEAISGAKYDRNAYGTLEEAAGSPVRDYVLRKQQREAEAKTAREAAMRDPNSPESIRQRAALKAVLPGVSDEVLAGVTAENAGDLFNTLKFGTTEATRKAEAEKEAARYAAEKQYRQGRDTVEDAFKRQQFASSADERRLRREELADQRSYTRGQNADKIERDARERMEKQQTDFGKQYGDSGAPGFYAKYDEVKSILDANPKDLPGFGLLEGRLPDATTSAAGVRLRQGIGQMLAEYRKGITGAGMSDAERKDYERITGLLESGTEERVRIGVEGLKTAMDQRAQALAAGYKPEAVRAYAQRAPSFPSAALKAAGAPDINLSADAAPTERKEYSKSRNKTRVLDPSGKVIRVEDGDTRRGG